MECQPVGQPVADQRLGEVIEAGQIDAVLACFDDVHIIEQQHSLRRVCFRSKGQRLAGPIEVDRAGLEYVLQILPQTVSQGFSAGNDPNHLQIHLAPLHQLRQDFDGGGIADDDVGAEGPEMTDPLRQRCLDVQVHLLGSHAINAVPYRHSPAVAPIRGGDIGNPGTAGQQGQYLRHGHTPQRAPDDSQKHTVPGGDIVEEIPRRPGTAG